MSLRARLGLAIAAILAVAYGAFGVAQYGTLRDAILGEIDETLGLHATSLVRNVERCAREDDFPEGLHRISLYPDLTHETALPEIFVQILSGDGTALVATQNAAALDIKIPTDLSRAEYQTTSAHGHIPALRILTVPVRVDGKRTATVLVGESLHLPVASLHRAVDRMVAVGAMLLLAAWCVVGLVIHQGLGPLRRVARAAREIAQTGDVTRRVSVFPGQDEVGQVAVAFNELVARVQDLLETQRRLLADTSHELRNPLTVLRTDLDLLRHDLDAATRMEVVVEAEKEAERMARLVDDLLLLAVAETAPYRPDTPVRLDAVARDVVARIRAVAGERTIELHVEERPVVRGHAEHLGQILRNLLENAVHYTSQQGTIRVSVLVHRDRALVEVGDDGVGVPAAHLPHVFDRFYRVDSSRSRASGGTGLGLSIARALAEAHGGFLDVESVEGKGSTFTLDLPTEPTWLDDARRTHGIDLGP
ncbi:MAG: HAMP domain-containing protein [Armatimonadetes bacterium]|nr:HAMP domain-containing protein [Armatimonadota bacterium]